jgi:hypothetical protein
MIQTLTPQRMLWILSKACGFLLQRKRICFQCSAPCLTAFSSDHFVGTVTSCFSRFVYQMRIAAMHHDPMADWTLDSDPRAAVEGWSDDWIMDP